MATIVTTPATVKQDTKSPDKLFRSEGPEVGDFLQKIFNSPFCDPFQAERNRMLEDEKYLHTPPRPSSSSTAAAVTVPNNDNNSTARKLFASEPKNDSRNEEILIEVFESPPQGKDDSQRSTPDSPTVAETVSMGSTPESIHSEQRFFSSQEEEVEDDVGDNDVTTEKEQTVGSDEKPEPETETVVDTSKSQERSLPMKSETATKQVKYQERAVLVSSEVSRQVIVGVTAAVMTSMVFMVGYSMAYQANWYWKEFVSFPKIRIQSSVTGSNWFKSPFSRY